MRKGCEVFGESVSEGRMRCLERVCGMSKRVKCLETLSVV